MLILALLLSLDADDFLTRERASVALSRMGPVTASEVYNIRDGTPESMQRCRRIRTVWEYTWVPEKIPAPATAE